MNPLPVPVQPAVYLALEPVDFRLGINGLCALVQHRLQRNASDPALFVFSNKRRNRIKLLYWYRNGFCLWLKQLEEDRFHWPRASGVAITLSVQQLEWLLAGIDISKITPHQSRCYDLLT